MKPNASIATSLFFVVMVIFLGSEYLYADRDYLRILDPYDVGHIELLPGEQQYTRSAENKVKTDTYYLGEMAVDIPVTASKVIYNRFMLYPHFGNKKIFIDFNVKPITKSKKSGN